MKDKVSIIGTGMTGSTAAHWSVEREIADIGCGFSGKHRKIGFIIIFSFK